MPALQEVIVSAARPLLVLSVALLGLAALPAADSPPVHPAPSADEIGQLVRQLGDKRFAVREAAQKRLWEAGAAAEPALRRALAGGDAEVVSRARALLDKFDWGIYPGTPPAVRAAIDRYRDGDDEARRQAVGELVRLGKPGYAALAKLAARADTPESRRLLGEAMTLAAQKAVPLLLVDRDYATAEALLEASLIGGNEDAAANYTALVLLRNKLDAALARWEAESKAGKSDRAADVLVALYRAKGDYAAARKHATGRDDLLDGLLWEQGDWKELARRLDKPDRDERGPAAILSLRAAYHRLAGDAKAADDALAKLKAIGDPKEERTATKELPSVARGLLLNERPADAFALLGGKAEQRAALFDLLTAQLRYREALALADQPGGDDESRPTLTLKQARALYLLGERDRAGQLFAALADRLKAPGDGEAATALVQAEFRLGLKDAAREHAARYLGVLGRLAVDEANDPTRRVLDAAFPKRGEAARLWWQFLRQKLPQDNELAVMKRLHDLLDPPPPTPPPAGGGGQGGGAGPDAFAEDFVKAQPDDRPQDAVRAREALAAAYEAAGRPDAARGQLAQAAERSGDPAAWQKLGDFLLGRSQFADAARAYAEAWKRNKAEPLPLYLQGWALAKAGRADEGRALMDQAHALPLGNVAQRALLVEELNRRDATEPARREQEMILRLGWARHWDVGNFLSALSRDAAGRKDFARAADAYERIVVGVLERDLTFQEDSAYLVVPALAHAHRARAALAAGRVAEAESQARACLALTPGNLDLAILLVPELGRRGQKAEADALYARAAGAYAGLCRDYPQSAFAHNSVAWLAACCRRDLDDALAHARTATELEPRNAGYRDTLAEVHFQRGDTAKALDLMRECVRAEPQKAYFAKQLRRFEAGDPTVPPPAEDED
jgi:hypothetical protein